MSFLAFLDVPIAELPNERSHGFARLASSRFKLLMSLARQAVRSALFFS